MSDLERGKHGNLKQEKENEWNSGALLLCKGSEEGKFFHRMEKMWKNSQLHMKHSEQQQDDV